MLMIIKHGLIMMKRSLIISFSLMMTHVVFGGMHCGVMMQCEHNCDVV